MTEIERARLKADIEKIKDFYGEEQFMKAIEELFELINAIARKDKENIIEEIADVEIMTCQLKMLLKCENKAEEIKRYKVDRQLKRMEKEKNESLQV